MFAVKCFSLPWLALGLREKGPGVRILRWTVSVWLMRKIKREAPLCVEER